jgi:pimeloyl-ACP methyl ester carboxylesterase
VFDGRGVGNTTTGFNPYTIEQLANDTAGLLDALKIRKADVLGYSLGSFVAQQLTITYPERVNRLILLLHLVVVKTVYLNQLSLHNCNPRSWVKR